MNSKWVCCFVLLVVGLILIEGLTLGVNVPTISQIPVVSPPITSELQKIPLTINPESTQYASSESSEINTGSEIDSLGSYTRPKEDLSTAIKVSEINVEDINTDYVNSQWITIGGVAGKIHKYDIDAKSLSYGPYEEPYGLAAGIKPKLGCWLAISIPVSASSNVRYIRIMTNTGTTSPYSEIEGIKIYNGNFLVGTYNTQKWVFGGVRAHTLDLQKWVKFANGMNIVLMIKNHSTSANRKFILNGVAAKEEW